jgi:hypothetical protein
MQAVQVFHVGSTTPLRIETGDFRSDDEGNLIVFRDQEIVAQFAPGKWSAVIKMDAPDATTTANPGAVAVNLVKR